MFFPRMDYPLTGFRTWLGSQELTPELALAERRMSSKHNLRQWEHVYGALIYEEFAGQVAGGELALGLGVGKESFSHFIVGHRHTKLVVLTDWWGNPGWKGESAPVECLDGSGLWCNTQTELFSLPVEAWGNQQITMTLNLLEPMPFAAASFDFVYSFSSLEHVGQATNGGVAWGSVGQVFKEVRRVLVDGGLFLMTVPFSVTGERFRSPHHWYKMLAEAGFKTPPFAKAPAARAVMTGTDNYGGGLISAVGFVVEKSQ